MGTFGKSFSREMGKNTGKFVSNKVFGKSGHATPHRIIRSSEGSISGGSGKSGGGLFSGIGSSLSEGTKGMFADMQAQREDDRIKREQKLQAKKEKEMKLEELSSFSVGSEKEEISENLNFLVSTANAQKDKNVRKICIEKIEFGIMKLRSNDGHAEADFFAKKLEELNKKKGLFGFLK